MNDNQYLVSICVPIYGVEKYIERCAVSLFEQSYQNIEYIFINDCTPDKSIEILNSVIERYPNRKHSVRIITHEKNRGLAAARNTAVDAVKGEFLMHVDSDDWIELDTVERCVDLQSETDSDLVSFDIKREWKNLSEEIRLPDFKNSKDMSIKMLNGTSFCGVVGHLIKVALYKDNNIRVTEGLNMGEDYFTMPRVAYHARKISNLHAFLYHYYFQNINSYVSSFSIDKAEQSWKVSSSLKTFFSNKGIDYIDAISITDVRRIFNHLKNCIRYNNNAYYDQLCKKLETIDKKYISKQPLPVKIFLVLRNRTFRKVYLKLLFKLSHIYRFYVKHLLNRLC